jgi:hypothetical protein
MATNSTEQNTSSTPALPSTDSPPKFTQPPPGQIPFNIPPPNMMNPTGGTVNPYSQYYQQYMQYMYSSMYSHPSYIQAYGISQANPAQAAAAMQNYYNYNQAASNTSVPPPLNLNNKPPVSTPKSETTANATASNTQKQAIKINLKFQQNNDEIDSSPGETKNNPKKSRFNATSLDSLSNVKQQQENFNKKQDIDNDKSKQTNEVVVSANAPAVINTTTPAKTTIASDIVYDINKWPVSLKEYCAKVYQHYQSITLVTEDQVGKVNQCQISFRFEKLHHIQM